MALPEKFLAKQKKSLLDEKKRVEEQIKKLKEYPDYGFDAEDNIREISDFENNQPLEKELGQILGKINKALTAIENKTYGKCKKCRKAISEDRLSIVPYADLCVECKSNGKNK